MTIDQAIKLTDALQPNPYPRDVKVRWLEMLDGRIFSEVLAVHEGCPAVSFDGYKNVDGSTVLLVQPPYDEDVYVHFLRSRIDLENGEATRYNRSVTLYNSAFEAFENHYRREHRPVSAGVFHM